MQIPASTHTHTHIRSRGIEFRQADYHMLYYCMLEEASVPLSSTEQMWAESSMRQRKTFFGCMMSSCTFKCLLLYKLWKGKLPAFCPPPPHPAKPPYQIFSPTFFEFGTETAAVMHRLEERKLALLLNNITVGPTKECRMPEGQVQRLKLNAATWLWRLRQRERGQIYCSKLHCLWPDFTVWRQRRQVLTRIRTEYHSNYNNNSFTFLGV